MSSLEKISSPVDEDDNLLAQFLEAEVLAECPDEEDLDKENFFVKPSKRIHLEEPNAEKLSGYAGNEFAAKQISNSGASGGCCKDSKPQRCIENGSFSKISTELFRNIFKFLSPEDLVNCAHVCQFMRVAASDECLWRRLYGMRWGSPLPDEFQGKLRACTWKQLYFERDSADMVEFVRNSPTEFREYYIQMQVGKRSEAPIASQVNDDVVILDTTVADQITQWKQSHGLPDVFIGDHVCSGRTCAYSQVGDVFLCEITGRVHVCDDTCRETVLDESNDLLVCTISGRCFDRWLSPSEEEADMGQQQGDGNVAIDEVEPLMGAGGLGKDFGFLLANLVQWLSWLYLRLHHAFWMGTGLFAGI